MRCIEMNQRTLHWKKRDNSIYFIEILLGLLTIILIFILLRQFSVIIMISLAVIIFLLGIITFHHIRHQNGFYRIEYNVSEEYFQSIIKNIESPQYKHLIRDNNILLRILFLFTATHYYIDDVPRIHIDISYDGSDRVILFRVSQRFPWLLEEIDSFL